MATRTVQLDDLYLPQSQWNTLYQPHSELFNDKYFSLSSPIPFHHPYDTVISYTFVRDVLVVVCEQGDIEYIVGVPILVSHGNYIGVYSLDTGMQYDKFLWKSTLSSKAQRDHEIVVWKNEGQDATLITYDEQILFHVKLDHQNKLSLEKEYFAYVQTLCAWKGSYLYGFREDILLFDGEEHTRIITCTERVHKLYPCGNHLYISEYDMVEIYAEQDGEWKKIHCLNDVPVVTAFHSHHNMVIMGIRHHRESLCEVMAVDQSTFAVLFRMQTEAIKLVEVGYYPYFAESSKPRPFITQICTISKNWIAIAFCWSSWVIFSPKTKVGLNVFCSKCTIDGKNESEKLLLFPQEDSVKMLSNGELFSVVWKFPWEQERLLWIAWKKNDPMACHLANLPKELIRYIIQYLPSQNPIASRKREDFKGPCQIVKEDGSVDSIITGTAFCQPYLHTN